MSAPSLAETTPSLAEHEALRCEQFVPAVSASGIIVHVTIGGTNIPRGTSKHKWTAELNHILMREFLAAGAHASPQSEATMRCMDVVYIIKDNTALQLPPNTDGKHCRDRFKFLMSKFETAQRPVALVYGSCEEFGMDERLWCHMKEETDAKVEKVEELVNQCNVRDNRLIVTGTTVRDMPMNQSARRCASSPSKEEGCIESLLKASRSSSGEAHLMMSNTMKALDRG